MNSIDSVGALYVYEVVLPDGSGGEQFEVLQRMSEDPLTKHPETGEPVRRVFGEPNAPRAWTDAHPLVAALRAPIDAETARLAEGQDGSAR